jgi:hypothetical protein
VVTLKMIWMLIGLVLVVVALWGLVRLVDRHQRKTWGDAPKQEPGRPSSIESKAAWFSGGPDGGGV